MAYTCPIRRQGKQQKLKNKLFQAESLEKKGIKSLVI